MKCPGPDGQGCDRDAEWWLIGPDGLNVPGRWCRHCAESAIAEFWEKMGEAWRMLKDEAQG